MAAETTIRDTLNTADPNRLDRALKDINFGDLVSLLMASLTPTESTVVVTASVGPIANQPSAVYQVNATAAGTTGIKKLLKGPITGPHAILPAVGECVWDGALSILFNATDAVTQMAVTYALATPVVASILRRSLGETDTPTV
jgi:hypothetical protein